MEYKPDIIDINMGCPVPKVAGNGSGAALMKDPELSAEIVRAAISESDVPVTVKIRKGWDEDNVNAVEFAMKMEKAGASAIAVHGRTRNQMYSGKSDIEIIKAVKDHPALESYFVKDEPRAQQFVKIGEHIKYLKQFDSTHGFYVNAFGNDASTKWLQTDDYPTYMKRYADEIGAGWFSFDMYPVTPEGKFLKNIKRPFPHDGMKKELKPTWFEQFETVLAFCKERKMPISAFALCTPHRNGGHWDYLPPSENEMKLELYVALAYGARHLQYFTFRSPNTNHDLFHNAPLDYATAKRTPIYDRVRNVNKELNSRAFVFLGAELPTVAHLGEPLPQGVKKFEKRPAFVKSLNVTDGGAVVSCFTNGKYEYLMVVNRELEKEITLKAEFIPGTERIAKDGSVVGTERQDGVYWLEVGAAEIFRIAK
jgi:hypothetical protein